MTTTKKKPHWTSKLVKLRACNDAVEWARGYSTLGAAWAACERGDWLLWLAGRLSGKPGSAKRRKLVLAACECARLALPFVKKGEERPRIAIETAERWARREPGITLETVRAAAYAAAAAAAAAAYADYAAAYAAYTAAAAAAYAAYAAVYAAYAAAAYAYARSSAVRKEILAQCAEIVRRHYPKAPRLP